MTQQQYDNANKGVLFINQRKQEDRHPDRKGQAQVECPHCRQSTEFWMDGWNNFNPDGSERVNVRFKPKDPAQAGQQARPQQAPQQYQQPRQQAAPQQRPQQPVMRRDTGSVADMDDDIPF